MPLPDEIGPEAIVDHRPQRPLEFEESAGELRAVMGGVPLQIDHMGSTSVPGLTAKDCVDVEIRVRSIDKARDIALLSAFGFRCRPEPWTRGTVEPWNRGTVEPYGSFRRDPVPQARLRIRPDQGARCRSPDGCGRAVGDRDRVERHARTSPASA
jgi:GrpB-like predicted nucleotidyltransferase (UPF0157 family)